MVDAPATPPRSAAPCPAGEGASPDRHSSGGLVLDRLKKIAEGPLATTGFPSTPGVADRELAKRFVSNKACRTSVFAMESAFCCGGKPTLPQMGWNCGRGKSVVRMARFESRISFPGVAEGAITSSRTDGAVPSSTAGSVAFSENATRGRGSGFRDKYFAGADDLLEVFIGKFSISGARPVARGAFIGYEFCCCRSVPKVSLALNRQPYSDVAADVTCCGRRLGNLGPLCTETRAAVGGNTWPAISGCRRMWRKARSGRRSDVKSLIRSHDSKRCVCRRCND